jgi:hypothetical protein
MLGSCFTAKNAKGAEKHELFIIPVDLFASFALLR